MTSFEEQAQALVPLLEPRDGHWPILVGHSLGAPVVARLAADHPGRVGVLVFVAGSVNPEFEDLTWYQELATSSVVKPFLVDFLQVATDEARATRGEVELLDPDLERVTCPVIVLHGTAGRLVPFEALEHTVEHFDHGPDVYVQVLFGEGHGMTKKRSQEMREILTAVRDGLLEGLWDDE